VALKKTLKLNTKQGRNTYTIFYKGNSMKQLIISGGDTSNLKAAEICNAAIIINNALANSGLPGGEVNLHSCNEGWFISMTIDDDAIEEVEDDEDE
jgi:hypothetical protein